MKRKMSPEEALAKMDEWVGAPGGSGGASGRARDMAGIIGGFPAQGRVAPLQGPARAIPRDPYIWHSLDELIPED